MPKSPNTASRSLTPLSLARVFGEPPVVWLLSPIEVPTPSELEFEIAFCNEVIKRNPEYIEVLVLLGDAYTRRGDYAKGLEIDQRLAQLEPDDKTVNYNLACSYALTDRKDEAFEALEKAVAFGFSDPKHMRLDRDLDSMKDDPRFEQLVRKVERRHAGNEGAEQRTT